MKSEKEQSNVYPNGANRQTPRPTQRSRYFAMPWFSMKDLSEADLKAMRAYLRSIPPVKNQVPFPISPATSANPRQE